MRDVERGLEIGSDAARRFEITMVTTGTAKFRA
jgi:hypothetical protein